MTDLTMYCFMALVVFSIIAAIVLVAGGHKSYIATPKISTTPKREATTRSRAQEIWNRLNPRIYLDDDETEPLPQEQEQKKAKQS
jgi:hypothetical protein